MLTIRLQDLTFQFQTGSIRSYARGGELGFKDGFNSKLVRLEDTQGKVFVCMKKNVSIPNWFD